MLNSKLKPRSTTLILAAVAAVAAVSWTLYLATAASQGPSRQTTATLPGGREFTVVCVESSDSSLARAEAADLVRSAIAERRRAWPGDWERTLPGGAVVKDGCPGGALEYSAERTGALERRVEQPAEETLQVYVARGVPGGYQRYPVEMLCAGGNCFEVTTALFIDPGVARSQGTLGEALELGLGVADRRAGRLNPESRPLYPDPNKPPAPPVATERPIDATLLGRGLCVVAVEPAAAATVVEAAKIAFGNQPPGSAAPSTIDTQCDVTYVAPPANFTRDDVHPGVAVPGGVGVVLFVPAAADRQQIFGWADSYRRIGLAGDCPAGQQCGATSVGVYLNPGLFDNVGVLAAVLRQALFGEAPP